LRGRGGFLLFDILAFPRIRDTGRRFINYLDLPLLPLLFSLLSTTTDPITYLLDTVSLYHELSNDLCVVPEWRVLLSRGSGADVYVMDCILGSRLGRKEGISHFYTLQSRGSSCGNREVGIELTDRFPKVN